MDDVPQGLVIEDIFKINSYEVVTHDTKTAGVFGEASSFYRNKLNFCLFYVGA